MKKHILSALVCAGLAGSAFAQGGEFEGLDKAMDPATFEKAGLNKLSGSERATLDEFVRRYVDAKKKDAAAVAASEAVDRAVKERRVQPPVFIESRIEGTFSGYNLRTVFRLANGQSWRPTNDETERHTPIQNPSVVIFRDTFGYKMFIEGAWSVRVKRVQ